MIAICILITLSTSFIYGLTYSKKDILDYLNNTLPQQIDDIQILESLNKDVDLLSDLLDEDKSFEASDEIKDKIENAHIDDKLKEAIELSKTDKEVRDTLLKIIKKALKKKLKDFFTPHWKK